MNFSDFLFIFKPNNLLLFWMLDIKCLQVFQFGSPTPRRVFDSRMLSYKRLLHPPSPLEVCTARSKFFCSAHQKNSISTAKIAIIHTFSGFGTLSEPFSTLSGWYAAVTKPV